jgi:hypothetical protein
MAAMQYVNGAYSEDIVEKLKLRVESVLTRNGVQLRRSAALLPKLSICRPWNESI